MLRLFAVDNTQFNCEDVYGAALASVSGERREKTLRLVPREKRNSSLAAGLAVPLALKACGYDGNAEISFGLYGKPYFKQPQGLFFNISHSADWTVIALSDSEVGVDIQFKRPVDVNSAARAFTPAERGQIEAAGEAAQELFYRYWTAKESYLKAIGTGLNQPLSSFSVSFNGDTARIGGDSENSYKIYVQPWKDEYCLAVCSLCARPDGEPEILKL